MLHIQNILFTTDFSICAESAFSEAAYLAAQFNSTLHVLHVQVGATMPEDNPLNYFPLEGSPDEARKLTVGERLRAAIEARDEEDVKMIPAQVRESSEIRGILNYAEANNVDLIVMGTHGRTGMGRVFIGSIAEKVVQQAKCPVFTVRERPENTGKTAIKRILVPFDFSSHATLALKYARELALTYQAAVDLYHVVPDLSLPQVYSMEPYMTALPDVKERCREAMKDLAVEYFRPDTACNVVVESGNPPREIIEFAKVNSVDLIVIATHGLTGFQHLLLGSVTEKVVRQAPCPVFTVHSFGRQPFSAGIEVSAIEEAT